MKLTDHEQREIIKLLERLAGQSELSGMATLRMNPSKYEWQSSRAKKDRSLELTSIFQEIMPGRRKIAVKVMDIFGNGTMTIVEVAV